MSISFQLLLYIMKLKSQFKFSLNFSDVMCKPAIEGFT